MKRKGFFIGAVVAVCIMPASVRAGAATKDGARAPKPVSPRPSAAATVPVFQTIPANISHDGQTITMGLGQILALTVNPVEGFSSVYPSFDERLLQLQSRHREPYTNLIHHLMAIKTGETDVSVLAANPGPDNYLGAEKTVFKVKVKIQAETVPLPPNPSDPSLITAADQDKTVEIPAGKPFLIRLMPEGNPNSVYPAIDEAQVQLIGHYRENGYLVYKFLLIGDSADITVKAATFMADTSSDRDIFKVTVKKKR